MRTTGGDPTRFLLVDGRPVALLEVAASRRARSRGLLGRDHLEGALLLERTRSVHTFGMRFPIDVARCTADLRVVAVGTMPPGRLTLPRWRVRAVVEAEAGSFAAWQVTAGSRLAVSEP